MIQEKKELNNALDKEKSIAKEADEEMQRQQNKIVTGKSRYDAINRLIA